MNELQSKWIEYIENYYRDKYPKTMKAKIAAIIPSGQAALQALYETLIHTVSAQYRTAPDVLAIEKAIKETAEAYPELSAPPVPLLTEAPRGSSVAEWTRLWMEALSENVNPRDYEPMREFMRKHGVEPDEATTQDAGEDGRI